MKYILICLMFFLTFVGSQSQAYEGSTKAAVTLAGGIIKSQHTENTKKYKRKNCPVCKGKGWYISGDKISKVDCGYCEAESSDSIVEHPPVIIYSPKTEEPKCNGPQCGNRPLSILKR